MMSTRIVADSKRDFENDADKVMVFVVDDDVSFLRAMKRLLISVGYSVATFESAEELLRCENSQNCGCLIADLRMPGDSGLDLQAKLNERDYALSIIFLTGNGDTESGVCAMKNGAVDFLLKPVENKVLFAAIEDAIEKHRHARVLFDKQASARKIVAKLTRREREVMSCVVAGMPNKKIAYKLNISEKTVKAHRGHVMHKAEARSIVDLVEISTLMDSIH